MQRLHRLASRLVLCCVLLVLSVSSMTQFIFIVWSVQGLYNPARRRRIRVVVQASSASVLCIQKSKLSAVSMSVVQESIGANFSDFLFALADGTRGGLVLTWNSQVVTITNSIISDNWITADS